MIGIQKVSNSNKLCIICKGSKFSSLYRGLLKCLDCGHIVANLSISDEELRSLYHKSYFSGEEYFDYLADEKVLKKNFNYFLNTINQFRDMNKHNNVLEVGSAYGFFLELAKNHFDSHLGIDITTDGVNHSLKKLQLNVKLADFTKARIPKKHYIGCMWDTIEHLRSPELYIEKFSKIMNSGSLLCLTTPDIGSRVALMRKGNWRMIHPPTHIHYFSRETLTQLLEINDFEIIHFEHRGSYRSIRNMLYIMLVLQRNMKSSFNIIPSFIKNIDIYLNLYDIMFLIARKK